MPRVRIVVIDEAVPLVSAGETQDAEILFLRIRQVGIAVVNLEIEASEVVPPSVGVPQLLCVIFLSP